MLTTKEIRAKVQAGKLDEIPEEDLAIFLENESKRKEYSKRGIKNLYKAVCLQAIEDYKKARRYLASGRRDSRDKAEKDKVMLEKFFNTEFFKDVSGVQDPEKIIRAIEHQMRQRAQRGLI